MLNTGLVLVGILIVGAFMYNIYSVTRNKEASKQPRKASYEREKPEPRHKGRQANDQSQERRGPQQRRNKQASSDED